MKPSRKIKNPIKGLYVILDHETLRGRDPLKIAESVIQGGAQVIQFRGKGLGDAELFEICKQLANLCKRRRIAFIVNDRVDIAWAVGAAGVHLGTQDLPFAVARKLLGTGRIIGVSSHSVSQAIRKARQKPSYLALGPIFKSQTKRTARALLGLVTVKQVARRVQCPVVAVGGIDARTAASVVNAGASAVAVVKSVLGTQRPEKAAKNLSQVIKKI